MRRVLIHIFHFWCGYNKHGTSSNTALMHFTGRKLRKIIYDPPPLPQVQEDDRTDRQANTPKRCLAMGVHTLQDGGLDLLEASTDMTEPGKKQSYGTIATRRVYERIRALQVGEDFTLLRSEWKVATLPTDSIGKAIRYRDHIKVRELEDGTGWIILRVKEAP